MSFFFSSRRRHTRCLSDWSSDVCSSDLVNGTRVVAREEEDGDRGGEGTVVGGEPATESKDAGDGDGGEEEARRFGEEQQIGRASCRERGYNSEEGGICRRRWRTTAATN